MNKKNYLKFASEIQQMIFDFVDKYNIPACCKLQQSAEDDIQWTLNLGDIFGSVNILIESWENASFKGKVNVLSIPMKYDTYRDTENLFKTRFGAVNSFNGKFVLNAFENAQNELKNAFKEVLELWAYGKKIKSNNLIAFCMN